MVARLEQSRTPTAYLSIYLYIWGCSLRELPLFCLTNFVRPNTGKTKILHRSIDRIWNYSGQKSWIFLLYIKSSPSPTGSNWIWYGQSKHQLEFVKKLNLDAQNPRSNTSIPSVCVGFVNSGYQPELAESKMWLATKKCLSASCPCHLFLARNHRQAIKEPQPPPYLQPHDWLRVLNHIKLGIAIIFWEGLSSIGLPSNFFLCSWPDRSHEEPVLLFCSNGELVEKQLQ